MSTTTEFPAGSRVQITRGLEKGKAGTVACEMGSKRIISLDAGWIATYNIASLKEA